MARRLHAHVVFSTLFSFALLSGCDKSDDVKEPPPSAAAGGTKTAETTPKITGGLRAAGEKAPDFSAVAHDGTEVSLKALAGKVVVLYFYPKDNTPGCTTEAQGFRDAHQAYQDNEAVIIGVSSQDNESHKEFAAEHGLPFVLLPDEEGTIAQSYGVGSFLGLAKRVTFIIDKGGTIAKVYEKVSPKNHAEEVLADIRSLKDK